MKWYRIFIQNIKTLINVGTGVPYTPVVVVSTNIVFNKLFFFKAQRILSVD